VVAVTGGAAPFGPALIEKFKEKCAPNEIKFREGKLLIFLFTVKPKLMTYSTLNTFNFYNRKIPLNNDHLSITTYVQ